MVFPAWTYSAVFVIGGLIAGVVFYVSAAQLHIETETLSALQITIINLMAYCAGLGILLIEPYAIRRMSAVRMREMLGLTRLPLTRDMGMALLAWSGYFTAMIIIASLIGYFLPSVNLDQAQEIDYETAGDLAEKLYAFVIIVLAAPVIEEGIFRGYLQGSLRRFMPWWLGGLITSALFGFVHGQWNVGVDVFVMSMVACYLRERTGAIWAGIGLHMIKNSIAYYILFWAPPWLVSLLGGP